MLKPFDEKVEAAIEKMTEEKNPRNSKGSMRKFYSAGKFDDKNEHWDGEGWYGGGWYGHFDY